ncbi:hypothetical protein [Lentzea sp. NEAU-D7]|uniref:hypothetical protein n=1 Tax=Lentzea sp. NEAU-D7 TaxID=2994667 RepID=UPI00224B05CD|nr:hypothetical protein [Lentzea sp. NEAU-D7]MCX2953468.1 hypothetical protein [Lentzea sp. NEAU-D7]
MDLSELCFHLRHRRGMYLPDDRYGTAVAFVHGYEAAFDGVPLEGFQEYVASRTGQAGSPIVWHYLVAAEVMPDVFDKGLGQIPAELGTPLTDRMLDLLEAFLVDQGGRVLSDIADFRAKRAERDRRSGRARGS